MGEYQSKACTFNDDIQGTASVVVAGLIASVRITGVTLAQHKFLFYGAGEAGVGIADLLAEAISKETGVEVGDARKNIWLMDSKGLVCDSRHDKLAEHKLHYAHHRAEGGCTSLLGES
jgi:malate dehydrogenase (oxaloacetate-decarboxylating)(NADP+)